MADNVVNTDPIKPVRPMIKMIIVAGLIIVVIGILYYIVSDRPFAALPFTLGVAATTALNVVKIRMLEKTVQKVISMDIGDQEAGKNTVRFQYLIRFFLTGVVLVAVGLIQNYTTAPPFYSSREFYLPIWALIFPNGPESLLTAPFISLWGALAGIFTMQISVILLRFMKLEEDGTEFIEYKDDDEIEDTIEETSSASKSSNNDVKTTINNTSKDTASDTNPDSSGRG